MKRLQSKGIGSVRKQAEPQEEELLWGGGGSVSQSRDTNKHYDLHEWTHYEVGMSTGIWGATLVRYKLLRSKVSSHTSKNRPGGLKGSKVKLQTENATI